MINDIKSTIVNINVTAVSFPVKNPSCSDQWMHPSVSPSAAADNNFIYLPVKD